MWIEGLKIPVAVLSLKDRLVTAINSRASELLGVDAGDLAGMPSSRLLPDYMLPSHDLVARWISDASAEGVTGTEVDLLFEPTESEPVRLSAHLSPADPAGEFLLLSLEEPEADEPGEAMDPEEALLGLMSDIGHIVGSSLDLEAVSQRFAISLMHVVPAEHVAVLLATGDDESMNLIFSTGQGTPGEAMGVLKDGPIARAIKTQEAVLLDTEEIGFLREHGANTWSYLDEKLLTACCVPLVSNGESIGVTLLASAVSKAFGPEDMELLETACNQVAGAISNLMLHERLAEGALERDVLANIGRLAGGATNFDGAMGGIAGEIKRFMPISELWVCEPNEASGRMTRAYVWTESGKDTDIDLESWHGADDTDSPASGVADTVELSKDGKPVNAAMAPMKFSGRTIGAVMIVAPDGESYSSRETVFTSMVANQISGAVHTARAYRNQQRETNLRRTLAQISLAASRDLAPDSVFERIANEVAELIEYDLFAIALPKPDMTGMHVRFHIGTDEVRSVYESTDEQQPIDAVEWRDSALTSAHDDPRFASVAADGINSVIEVSLGTRENGCAGHMLIGSRAESAFSEQVLRTLSHVAAQVTPAIQNAMAHEQAVELAEARMAEARAEARNLELEKINDAKSQFLSVVSHELRTPLTSIITYAELLARNIGGSMSEKQMTQAKVINKSATHLKFLISDLLDVSRIESGNLSLEMSRFEIGEVVRDVVDQFEPVLAEKQQVLEAHVTSESIQIHADRSRIVQVISNLVENASKYSPPETAITVDVYRRAREVVIAITDQGVGISSEDQKQLFVAFFRANSELTRSEPGTGLGLALVRSIAEMHGGSVSVNSELGKGSTFSVALRAASGEQAA